MIDRSMLRAQPTVSRMHVASQAQLTAPSSSGICNHLLYVYTLCPLFLRLLPLFPTHSHHPMLPGRMFPPSVSTVNAQCRVVYEGIVGPFALMAQTNLPWFPPQTQLNDDLRRSHSTHFSFAIASGIPVLLHSGSGGVTGFISSILKLTSYCFCLLHQQSPPAT
jgi:hypothetical protein